MKFICLTLLIITGATDSRSERFEVVGPADPVFAVAGEDVILPCSVKPNISVVDMRVEWFRADQKDSKLVHLYEDHEDRNTDQIQSYRERTKLIHQELQRGNASLKLSSVRVSDEGRYKCFIQFKSWNDDATVDVRVEVCVCSNLSEINDADKTALLDSPVSPMGSVMDGFAARFTTAQKLSHHFLLSGPGPQFQEVLVDSTAHQIFVNVCSASTMAEPEIRRCPTALNA